MAEPYNLILSRLLEQAPEGNELARAALPGARDEVLPPPQISLSSGQSITPFDTGMQNTEFSAPELPGPSQAVPDAEEKGPSWWDQNKGNIIKGGISALAGIFGGESGKAFGTGLAGQALSDIQRNQSEQLQRRQRAWEDAYSQATALPSEVLTDPKFSELAQAQQALLKDMADGKVDNEKTLSQFLTAKSKFSTELQQAASERDYQVQKEIEDKQMMDQFSRQAQLLAHIENVLQDPTHPEYAQAQQMKAQMPEVVDTEFGRIPMNPEMKARWLQWQAERQYQKSRDEQGDTFRDRQLRLTAAGQKQNQEQFNARARQAQSAQVLDAVQNSMNRRYQIAATTGMGAQTPEQQTDAHDQALLENAQAIEAASGLEIQPGDIDDHSKGIEAHIILNGVDVPINWDPNSVEGKLRILRLAYGSLQGR